jgi:endonuclease/exonuclease/phosphatase (EEP) superfamily protein YafD
MAFSEGTGEVFGLIFKVLTVIVLVFTLLGFLAASSAHCEMLVNYRMQFAVVSIILFILFIVTKSWIWVLVAAVPLFINIMDVAPCYALSRTAPRGAESKSVSFYVVNVKLGNDQFDEIISQIVLEDADVVVLEEITDQWNVLLGRELGETYPHVCMYPDEDGYGCGVLSKLPLFDGKLVELGKNASPCLVVKTKVMDHPLTLFGVQLTSATNGERQAARNEEVEELAELVKGTTGMVAVMGSVAASTWSPALKNLEADTGLLDARKGFGVQPTWPSYLPGLQIPIDHCLLSEGITATSVRRGSACGSDHFPLFVEAVVTGSEALERIQ